MPVKTIDNKTETRARSRRSPSLTRRIAEMSRDLQSVQQTARDLADANEVLSQASERFQNLFQELPIPTFSYAADGSILEWNRAFAAHQSIKRSQTRPVWELVAKPGEWSNSRDILRRVLDGEVIEAEECECRLANGDVTPILFSTFPMKAGEGDIVGGLGTYLDISEMKRGQEERETHARQQLALMELGQLALSGAPLASLIDDACRFVRETMGADRAWVLEVSSDGAEMIVAAASGWPSGYLGSRIATGAPAQRTAPSYSAACKDAELFPPISRRRRDAGAERVATDGGERRKAVAGSIVPVTAGDLEQEPRFAARDELRRHGVVSGVCAAIFEGLSAYGYIAALSDKPRQFSSQDARFLQSVTNVIASALQRHRAARQIEDYMTVLEEQKNQLEQANARLEFLATVDGLTGLKNHRYFQEQLSMEFQRAQRSRRPLSLILLDVDHFKRYNDSFGHPDGDDVLRAVASILRRECRTHDIVARYGGEEFVVVLPDTDAQMARTVAERLRAEIENANWLKRKITVSLGVSSMHERMRESSRLIGDADRALYYSKHNGRNRVSLATQRGTGLAKAS